MTMGAMAVTQVVNRAGQPGHPAPLGGSGDDEPLDLALACVIAQACIASIAFTAP